MDQNIGEVDVIEIRKQKLNEKLEKASNMHKQRLQQVVEKAKAGYTKFAPSQETMQKIKCDKLRNKRCQTVRSSRPTSFFIPIHPENEDNYVFIQASSMKVMETTKTMKNIKAKPSAIAFEIDRVEPRKSINTTRATVGSQVDQVWWLI